MCTLLLVKVRGEISNPVFNSSTFAREGLVGPLSHTSFMLASRGILVG